MIKYVGVNDHEIDLFEGQYKVKNGMSYNSYVIMDERIAIVDTVDAHFVSQWLHNIETVLEGKNPTDLIILHMEPDHSAGIEALLKKYPYINVIGNAKTFSMISQFFDNLVITHKTVVKDKDVYDLKNHKLQFIFAPMVHWPEVMVMYDEYSKSLFSADAFGKFGALDVNEDWVEEARRYYIGIVGKYGLAVQALFKKLKDIDIKVIYPLHGPKLDNNLGMYLDLYNKWSTYTPEENGVCIAYCSIYGNTKKACEMLKSKLNGKVEIFDLARCDMSLAVGKAFQYDNLILATPTYNNGVFPPMEAFLHALKERTFQNRKIGIIENGSWAPVSKKYILNYLSDCKNLSYFDNNVTIVSSLNEKSMAQINALACEINSK